LQQLPPFPDDPAPDVPADPTQPSEPTQPFEPGQPAEPSIAPAEAPNDNPNIDIPSPASPGTEAPTTPISPVA
jgi:hypothetical protein